MKKRIKSFLICVLHPIVLKLGYQKKIKKETTENKNHLIHNCFTIFKSIGFDPKYIIDIGANRGGWTREVLRHFPNAYFTMFEPQANLHHDMKDLLCNPKIECVGCGVGHTDGNEVFTFLDRDDSSSFVYTERQASKEGYSQSVIPMVTLNKFLENSSKPLPGIIKIDAEGLDLEVLKGATNFLGKTEVILIEAGVVCKTYDNTIYEVIKSMDGYGYRLFEITDMNRPLKQKVLWLTELVFILKGGVVDSECFS